MWRVCVGAERMARSIDDPQVMCPALCSRMETSLPRTSSRPPTCRVSAPRRPYLYEELLLPRFERLEGAGVIHVEHQAAAIGAAIEGRAEALKALLARRVPNLQRGELAVDGGLLGPAT